MSFVSGALDYRSVTYFRIIVLMKDRDCRYVCMAVSVRSVWLKSPPDTGGNMSFIEFLKLRGMEEPAPGYLTKLLNAWPSLSSDKGRS